MLSDCELLAADKLQIEKSIAVFVDVESVKEITERCLHRGIVSENSAKKVFTCLNQHDPLQATGVCVGGILGLIYLFLYSRIQCDNV